MTKNRITSIEQLNHNLGMGAGYDGYRALIEAIELDANELSGLRLENGTEHQRVCLYDTPAIEAVISFWKPGQVSPIHDYNSQQAWTKVLKGQLVLEFFDVFEGEAEAEITETQLMDENDIIYMNNSFGFHRYANLGTEDVAAIHIYADKIDRWRVYDECTGKVEVEATSYDRIL